MDIAEASKKQCGFENFVNLSACDTVGVLQEKLVVLVSQITEVPVRLYQCQKVSDGIQLVAIKDRSKGKTAITEISSELARRYQADLDLLSQLPQAIRDCKVTPTKDHCIFHLRSKQLLRIYLICDGRVSSRQHVLIKSLLAVYANMLVQMQFSLTDGLTGLLNRQGYEEKLTAFYLRNRSQRLKRRANDGVDLENCCLAFIDIDYFKEINDCHGHLYGDEVLVAIAQLMQQFFREEDMLFRYGGDEFVVALMNVDFTSSHKVLERFRKAVSKISLAQIRNISVSIGYTQLKLTIPYQDVARQADAALYYSKEQGRNRVSCYETLVRNGLINPIGDESSASIGVLGKSAKRAGISVN
jgi:diguanylate cyclase (GGDEF)-like protein